MVKIRKQYKDKYTVVLNTVLEDKRLSYKAVGLFVDLWHSPDDWDYYLSEIVKRHTDGKDKVNSGLEELEKYGYLNRSEKHRNDNGTFDSYDWQLTETPEFNQSGKTAAENHRVGKTAAENPTLQSTKRQSTEINKVSKDVTTTAACLNFYKENVGNLPPIISQQIQQYCNNMSPKLVKEAISRSVESGKSWRNAKGILESWQLKKVATLDDVKHDDEQFAKSKQPKPRANYGRPTINKKMPESMKEQYDPEKDKLSPEQKAETERMLAEFQRSAEND